MTSLLSLKNILNFPSYAEQKPVLKMTYKALFDQPPLDFNILFFSLSTTVPLASLTVLKFAPPRPPHLAFIPGSLHLSFLSYREHILDICLVHLPPSSGVCSKDLFSTRSIMTIPLNIAIESFYPFPALFFCVTLLPSYTLYTLLNYVVYYLFVVVQPLHCAWLFATCQGLCSLTISINSKHHESRVHPDPHIPSHVTGRGLIDVRGISEH